MQIILFENFHEIFVKIFNNPENFEKNFHIDFLITDHLLIVHLYTKNLKNY